MKNVIKKYGKHIAALALMVTVSAANTACGWLIYQPKVPDNLKNFRKF